MTTWRLPNNKKVNLSQMLLFIMTVIYNKCGTCWDIDCICIYL